MQIQRRHFIMGVGATAATVATPNRAMAQGGPQPPGVDLGGQGALYRFPLDIGWFRSVFFTVAALPRRSFAASIVQQTDRADALWAVRDVGRSSGATVAINGAFFNGAFAPDGLLIIDGKVIAQKRADWRGYLVIDGSGNASVTTRPQLRLARYAVQGYPTIVEPGGKIGIHSDDREYTRRTVIAQSGDTILAIATSPISLFELAYALIERPDAFNVNGIDAALNLSGAATTSFYAKVPGSDPVIIPARWPNRDVITFSMRTAANNASSS